MIRQRTPTGCWRRRRRAFYTGGMERRVLVWREEPRPGQRTAEVEQSERHREGCTLYWPVAAIGLTPFYVTRWEERNTFEPHHQNILKYSRKRTLRIHITYTHLVLRPLSCPFLKVARCPHWRPPPTLLSHSLTINLRTCWVEMMGSDRLSMFYRK